MSVGNRPVNMLEFIKTVDMQNFLCRHKTDLSCMENPMTFVRKLRDNRLISEDRYKEIKDNHGENQKTAVYNALESITYQQNHIRCFWKCVFDEAIANQYPTLQRLRENLIEEAGLSESESAQVEMVNKKQNVEVGKDKKKTTKTARPVPEDDEQPGPSSRITPRTTKELMLVKCGKKKGLLDPDKLAQRKNCILVNHRWYNPSDFERLGGRESSRKWKESIRYRGRTLTTLIQKGRLKCGNYRRR